jgi:ABC-type transporter Mla MlaB component
MFRITEQRMSGRLVLKLEGRLSGPWVDEVDACWRAAAATCDGDSIWVDLSDVCSVDLAGQAQLTRMHRAGARFLTRGCVMRELVREIVESH